jgi:hypothetical protein
MKSLEEIRKILTQHKVKLAEEFSVASIGVFGSVVRGEQERESDVDILVEFSQPISLFRYADLESALEKVLGSKVDVVTKSALKPVIGRQILSEVVYV